MNRLPAWGGPLVFGMVAMICVSVLAALHVDTAATSAIIGAVLGALYGKVEQVHQQTNGNTSQLLALVRDLSAKVAEMTPAPPPPDQHS